MARKAILMTLYISELVYDIQNKTYLTGRSRRTGANHEEVANMQANEDEENANQVLRSIQNAFGTLKTKLSEWLDEGGTSATDRLISDETEYYSSKLEDGVLGWSKLEGYDGEKCAGVVSKASELPASGITGSGTVYAVVPNLTVTLVMPSNYNSSTRETINAALHQYIVNTSVGDWFTITNKADAADYYTLAAANIETIREAANKRVRPVRREA